MSAVWRPEKLNQKLVKGLQLSRRERCEEPSEDRSNDLVAGGSKLHTFRRETVMHRPARPRYPLVQRVVMSHLISLPSRADRLLSDSLPRLTRLLK